MAKTVPVNLPKTSTHLRSEASLPSLIIIIIKLVYIENQKKKKSLKKVKKNERHNEKVLCCFLIFKSNEYQYEIYQNGIVFGLFFLVMDINKINHNGVVVLFVLL